MELVTQSDVFKNISYTYSVIGDGQVLILIPGTLGDENLFAHIQRILSDKYRVFVFDHLKEPNFQKMIDDYHILFTENLNLTSFILGGTSVGGWISQHYTSKYPEFVRALIIGNSFSDNEILITNSMKLYKISKFVPWFLLRSMFSKTIIKAVDKYSEYESEYFIHSLNKLGKKWLRVRLSWSLIDSEEFIIKTNIPKLIIYTADDSVVNSDLTGILKQSYPEAKIAKIETGDHYPYRTNYEEYGKLLLNFLRDLKK